MYADKILTCADCGQAFTFTASEQEFYSNRQFSEPRRCASCRAARKAQRGDGGYGAGSSFGSGGYGGHSGGYGAPRAPREMFTTTCSSCGQEAKVPFQPTSGKPVYCNDCFASRRA
ncbi:MAG TPA: CxxC-x17-CxxC domain-containing protein [Candidatus Limnocylindrales bacterium]|nr:CxxC-x17-CxxC domain-containing protein [Candidatus Limnocylindrales bacterium]